MDGLFCGFLNIVFKLQKVLSVYDMLKHFNQQFRFAFHYRLKQSSYVFASYNIFIQDTEIVSQNQ